MFKIQIIYQLSESLDESEIGEVKRMQNHLKDGDEYEVDFGYWDLINDPIAQINPRKFLPDNRTNHKYFSEVVFISGNVSYAVGKPETVYQKIEEYIKGNS